MTAREICFPTKCSMPGQMALDKAMALCRDLVQSC